VSTPQILMLPGSGISANLADKAKAHGIPVWRFSEPAPARKGGGA
jgi:hypothetical protein